MKSLGETLDNLKHWLRRSWLSRLPGIGALIRGESTSSRKRRQARRKQLEMEVLESKSLPDEGLSIASGVLAGEFLTREFGQIVSPTQVLMGGWEVNQPYTS